MFWDSTGASDLDNSTVIHPRRWLPVTPLKTKRKKEVSYNVVCHDIN